MKKLCLLLIALLLISLTSKEQEWTDYQSLNNVNVVTYDNNLLWIGTSGGVIVRSSVNGSLIDKYTIKDGLADSYVISIAIDIQGNKWFATSNGVSKFDGTNWFTYNTSNSGLPENSITAVAIDAQNNLWFGTYWHGIVKYNGTTWTAYNTNNSGLVNDIIHTIAIDRQGNKWFGTEGGISRFNGTSWTNYTTSQGLPSNQITSIVFDNSGIAWAGTYSDGLAKLNNSNWVTVATPGNIWTLKAENNDIWIGGDDGLKLFDGANLYSYEDPYASWDGSTYLCSLDIDNAGNKWCGYYYDGLKKFDGSSWTSFIETSGLLSNDVRLIKSDSYGNEWIGTSLGLSKFNGTDWISYSSLNSIPAFGVSDIAIDNEGNKWIAWYSRDCKNAGIAKFDNLNWTIYYTLQNAYDASKWPICLAIDSYNNIWMGFNWTGGIAKFNGASFTYYSSSNGLINDFVNTIAIDEQNNKWIGTLNGVSKFDGTTWTNFTTANGLINNFVTKIAVDREDNKWFGTGGYGVSKFNGTNWTSYTTANGLADNYVNDIVEDGQGSYWFATGSGSSKFDGLNWTSYNSSNDELMENLVSDIEIDEENIKWFATGEGVAVYNDNTTGIENNRLSESVEVRVYPNPATDVLHIINANEKSDIIIYDLVGKELMTCKLQNGQINIKELPSGIYAIRIKSDKSGKVIKIIKH